MKVREKKRLSDKFHDYKALADWKIYKNAKREAKKAIAVTRTVYYKDVRDKLETRNGKRDLYRLVEIRHECTQDIEHFCCVI